MFDAEIAAALGDVNAAIIVQQLNYWMNKKGVGAVINGIKYVYNTFVDWVNEQFPWLSVWQFRKAMSLLRSLGIVKVIRHRAKQWNQTNYYSLDCDRLAQFLNGKIATTTEISELCLSSSQSDEDRSLEMSDSKLSYIDTKNTTKEITAEQSDRQTIKEQNNIAAASPKTTLEKEKQAKDGNPPNSKSPAVPEGINDNLSFFSQGDYEDKSFAQVEQIVNLKWKESISDLDKAGIPVNKTLVGLLKLYPKEKVDSAIALLRARKREQHVSNPAGYFVSALKGDWGSSLRGDGDDEVDTASVFRHWYDLARELGYCSGQEVRGGEQWVCLSGAWEKWNSAVERGYSLDYLKKILKRNKG